MDIRNDRQKGMSYVELGQKYHMDPRTAKRYAESPQKPEYTLSEPKPTKMDPYKQIVDEWLEEAPYSAQRILEKLREMGFDGGYSIVKAYVSSRKMDLNEKATVRFETMPGKQGQTDWGFFEDHLVYEDGKWKKLYCFLMILGYSRMRYIEFVTDMSTNTLIRCHQNAFRYFGGYPEEMLYNNMKQTVIKRLLKQEDSTQPSVKSCVSDFRQSQDWCSGNSAESGLKPFHTYGPGGGRYARRRRECRPKHRDNLSSGLSQWPGRRT